MEDIWDRPLKCMSAEEHNERLRENLLERHLEWCTELRDVTLGALSNRADLVAARNSFAYAAKTNANTWYKAKAKLQTYGQIHAWALSERHGLPKRYQAEGQQIADCFMHGVPWEGWCPWDGSIYACARCNGEFRNPYQYSVHPCAARSKCAEGRVTVQ